MWRSVTFEKLYLIIGDKLNHKRQFYSTLYSLVVNFKIPSSAFFFLNQNMLNAYNLDPEKTINIYKELKVIRKPSSFIYFFSSDANGQPLDNFKISMSTRTGNGRERIDAHPIKCSFSKMKNVTTHQTIKVSKVDFESMLLGSFFIAGVDNLEIKISSDIKILGRIVEIFEIKLE